MLQATKYLWKKCTQQKWLEPFENDSASRPGSLGVLARRSDGTYTTEPIFLNADVLKAAEKLGVAFAITISSEIIWSLLENHLTPRQTQLTFASGLSIPIVKSIRDIGSESCSVTSINFCCFCREENFALVWEDSLEAILSHGAELERVLFQQILDGPEAGPATTIPPPRASGHASLYAPKNDLTGTLPLNPAVLEKLDVIQAALDQEDSAGKMYDPEKAKHDDLDRPFLLGHGIMVSLAIILVIVVEMACVAKVCSLLNVIGNQKQSLIVAE
jgi:hypothetical protein